MNKLFKPFTDSEILEINHTISEVETTTDAEICPVITAEVSNLKLIGFRLLFKIFQVLTFGLGIALIYTALKRPLNIGFLVPAAALGALIILTLKLLEFLKLYCQNLVIKEAKLEFEHQGISETLFSNGVLIFISLKNKRIVVLADEQIKHLTSDETWTEAVVNFHQNVKSSNLKTALIALLKEVGAVCEKVCPKTSSDQNEIKNEIIIKG